MTSANTSSIRIAGDRLWSSLMEMAEIGKTPRGGCNRQALTDEDKQGRDLFVSWCRAAGCEITIDNMGNIFARRAGKNASHPSVIAGSHLDTQPTGGKYDGVYGVLAGLEVIRTLNDNNLGTEHPIEVVCWTNEEGARFSPAILGSGVWAGTFNLEYGHSRTDKEGRTTKDELQRIGYLGAEECRPKPVKAAFEVHIEQGPILENQGLRIGVVSGVQAMGWYDLIIEGVPCHAGTTPMEIRRDPFMALYGILDKLYQVADDFKPWARMTFGDIRAEPGSRNTVPERLIMTVDMRHPDQEQIGYMERIMREIVVNECSKYRLTAEVKKEWNAPAIKFDGDCINAVRNAADSLGYSNMEMVSGAGHDSVNVSKVAPTSMIFIPCEGGLSHNEAENASKEDLEAGCNVLLHTMLEMATQYLGSE